MAKLSMVANTHVLFKDAANMETESGVGITLKISTRRLNEDSLEKANQNTSIGSQSAPTEVFSVFLLLNMGGPGLMLSLFGVATNILSIMTFVKQGVRDTINISLSGLATSDLFSQMSLVGINICYVILVYSSDLYFVVCDVQYMFGWSHILFTRITAWITAYVTLERCLCVALPLKVKDIFTPKRTRLYVVCVNGIMIGGLSPCFYLAKPIIEFDTSENGTLFRLRLTDIGKEADNISFLLNNILPMIAFFLVIAFTATLVYNLQQNSKWREQISTAGNVNLSTRDTKIVKMVIFVAAAFIGGYLPGTVVFIWLLLEPQKRVYEQNNSQLEVIFSALFNIESLGASLNIFIYFFMSTKFKHTLTSVLTIEKLKKRINSFV